MMTRCSICGAPLTGLVCSYCGAAAQNSRTYYQKTQKHYTDRTDSREYRTEKEHAADAACREVSRKSRLIALLLCLFLGWLGIHRFYVGKIGSGIVYACTRGFFGVGWVMDLIMIILGSFEDASGLPLAGEWEV